jgi:hypothetical protein
LWRNIRSLLAAEERLLKRKINTQFRKFITVYTWWFKRIYKMVGHDHQALLKKGEHEKEPCVKTFCKECVPSFPQDFAPIPSQIFLIYKDTNFSIFLTVHLIFKQKECLSFLRIGHSNIYNGTVILCTVGFTYYSASLKVKSHRMFLIFKCFYNYFLCTFV